jgi:hypothetical protein
MSKNYTHFQLKYSLILPSTYLNSKDESKNSKCATQITTANVQIHTQRKTSLIFRSRHTKSNLERWGANHVRMSWSSPTIGP